MLVERSMRMRVIGARATRWESGEEQWRKGRGLKRLERLASTHDGGGISV